MVSRVGSWDESPNLYAVYCAARCSIRRRMLYSSDYRCLAAMLGGGVAHMEAHHIRRPLRFRVP